MAEKKSDKQRIQEGELLLRVILEIAGTPKDHVEKAISLLVDKLEDKDYVSELTSEEVLEAKEHPEHKNLFTALAELELWIKRPINIVDLAFDFMPASIEVLEPEKPKIDNKIFSTLLNELMAKLHKSDMAVKNVSANKQLLERNINILLRNFVIDLIKNGRNSVDDISKATGMPSDQLNNFIGLLEKSGEVRKEGDAYVMAKGGAPAEAGAEAPKEEKKTTKKKISKKSKKK